MNYEIIDIKYIEDEMKITPPYDVYTIRDANDIFYKVFINYEWYNNLTYTSITWFDNRANGFDLARVLYNHDRNLISLLPEKYITREMEKDFNKNSQNKFKKTKYKTIEEEINAYNEEELRHLNLLGILLYKSNDEKLKSVEQTLKKIYCLANIKKDDEKYPKTYKLKLRKNT